MLIACQLDSVEDKEVLIKIIWIVGKAFLIKINGIFGKARRFCALLEVRRKKRRRSVKVT